MSYIWALALSSIHIPCHSNAVWSALPAARASPDMAHACSQAHWHAVLLQCGDKAPGAGAAGRAPFAGTRAQSRGTRR